MKQSKFTNEGLAMMAPDLLSEYLSVREVLVYLKICRTSLWRYTNAGLLRPRKIGRKTLFLRSEIDAYLRREVAND